MLLSFGTPATLNVLRRSSSNRATQWKKASGSTSHRSPGSISIHTWPEDGIHISAVTNGGSLRLSGQAEMMRNHTDSEDGQHILALGRVGTNVLPFLGHLRASPNS